MPDGDETLDSTDSTVAQGNRLSDDDAGDATEDFDTSPQGTGEGSETLAGDEDDDESLSAGPNDPEDVTGTTPSGTGEGSETLESEGSAEDAQDESAGEDDDSDTTTGGTGNATGGGTSDGTGGSGGGDDGTDDPGAPGSKTYRSGPEYTPNDPTDRREVLDKGGSEDNPFVPDAGSTGLEDRQFGNFGTAGEDTPTNQAIQRLQAEIDRKVPGVLAIETGEYNIRRRGGQLVATLTESGRADAVATARVDGDAAGVRGDDREPAPLTAAEARGRTEARGGLDGRKTLIVGGGSALNPGDDPTAIVLDPAGDEGRRVFPRSDDPFAPDDPGDVRTETGVSDARLNELGLQETVAGLTTIRGAQEDPEVEPGVRATGNQQDRPLSRVGLKILLEGPAAPSNPTDEVQRTVLDRPPGGGGGAVTDGESPAEDDAAELAQDAAAGAVSGRELPAIVTERLPASDELAEQRLSRATRRSRVNFREDTTRTAERSRRSRRRFQQISNAQEAAFREFETSRRRFQQISNAQEDALVPEGEAAERVLKQIGAAQLAAQERAGGTTEGGSARAAEIDRLISQRSKRLSALDAGGGRVTAATNEPPQRELDLGDVPIRLPVTERRRRLSALDTASTGRRASPSPVSDEGGDIRTERLETILGRRSEAFRSNIAEFAARRRAVTERDLVRRQSADVGAIREDPGTAPLVAPEPVVEGVGNVANPFAAAAGAKSLLETAGYVGRGLAEGPGDDQTQLNRASDTSGRVGDSDSRTGSETETTITGLSERANVAAGQAAVSAQQTQAFAQRNPTEFLAGSVATVAVGIGAAGASARLAGVPVREAIGVKDIANEFDVRIGAFGETIESRALGLGDFATDTRAQAGVPDVRIEEDLDADDTADQESIDDALAEMERRRRGEFVGRERGRAPMEPDVGRVRAEARRRGVSFRYDQDPVTPSDELGEVATDGVDPTADVPVRARTGAVLGGLLGGTRAAQRPEIAPGITTDPFTNTRLDRGVDPIIRPRSETDVSTGPSVRTEADTNTDTDTALDTDSTTDIDTGIDIDTRVDQDVRIDQDSRTDVDSEIDQDIDQNIDQETDRDDQDRDRDLPDLPDFPEPDGGAEGVAKNITEKEIVVDFGSLLGGGAEPSSESAADEGGLFDDLL